MLGCLCLSLELTAGSLGRVYRLAPQAMHLRSHEPSTALMNPLLKTTLFECPTKCSIKHHVPMLVSKSHR